ncbi:MAG: hypothetical protein DRP60_15575 [Spirochaetes bacterium]|nr:MAG: hypothetical protein DRP60_15575 [Spirochaetota bacterium]
MHTIHIRNVSDELFEKLSESSKYSHRSIAREALVLLRDALDANANEMLKRRRIIHDMDSYRYSLKLDEI